MKGELGGGDNDKFCCTKRKNLYLLNRELKKCAIKRKLKSENYKNCLEATQLETKINYLEKKLI